MVKRVLIKLFFSVIIGLFAGIAHSGVIKDGVGREVHVPDEVKRVVCLGPGALRLVVYLQASDRVVGVEELEKRYVQGRPYRIAHPEFDRLPSVGPGGPESINHKPDMEALLKVAPDVIFITYMEKRLAEEVQETLKIPVVVLNYGRFATFDEVLLDSIKIAGKILGKENRADELLGYMEHVRAELHGKTQDILQEKKPRVYVGGIGYKGAYGIESTEQYYLPLEWTNSINLAKELPSKVGSHVFSDKEVLIKLDPDVIFVDGGGRDLVISDFRKKPDFYKALKAFKNNSIYVLYPFNSYTTNVETVLVDSYATAKILYPDHFPSLDIEEKAREIYKFFVGQDVYDEMKKVYGPLGHKMVFEDKPGGIK